MIIFTAYSVRRIARARESAVESLPIAKWSAATYAVKPLELMFKGLRSTIRAERD